MKKTKKIVALSGGTILACTNLLGCTSNPTTTYLTEIQNLSELKNYDFKFDMVMDLSDEHENINLDFTLEGEIINNEWFYTKVMYKDKCLSDIIIQDDKIFLNVGSISRNLTPNEIISTEVIQVLSVMHTMLFDAKDYVCIDLKNYGLTSKELLKAFESDNADISQVLNDIYLEEFKALLDENKEIVTKEDGKYNLKINNEKLLELFQNISTSMEERKADLIPQLENDFTTVFSMDIFKKYIPLSYTDEEITELAEMQYDSIIQSIENLSSIDTELSQTLFKEKNTYYNKYVFNIGDPESDATIMIGLDSVLTDKQNSTEHTYDIALPDDSISVEKLIENFITYAGDMNIPLDSDTLSLQ